MKNATQFKAKVRNLAKEQNIAHDYILYHYMMGKLLERIAGSKYSSNFIIKGGFLLCCLVGLQRRTTADLDATIKDLPLNAETISNIFEEILEIPADDQITFKLIKITEICRDRVNPGLRIKLDALFSPIKVHLSIDLTSGDSITPGEVKTSIPLLFDEGTIEILAYPVETILAEKLETILSRETDNSRPRDFYDLHLLTHLPEPDYDPKILSQALINTMTNRKSLENLSFYENTLQQIRNDQTQIQRWNHYQQETG